MSYRDPILGASRASSAVDQGLRSYMIQVYNFMAAGLGLTGAVAFFASQSSALMQLIFGTPLQWLVVLAPLGMVVYLSVRIQKMQASTAQLMFWVYAALMGLSLSSIFLLYTGESIARIFFISASVFASMSLYGYTTKKDLTAMGSFLIMGLFGVIIASVVNMAIGSSTLQLVLSILTVFIFTGLTAYDTQKIKSYYRASDTTEESRKKAIMGALNLYLDFINIFLALLRIFGDRR